MSIDSKLELLNTAKAASVKTKAFERLHLLFDEGTFVELDAFAKSEDSDAEAIAGFGCVNGCPAYAFAQNSDVCGGAMSKAQAAKIKKVYDFAVKTGAPVIGLYDSIGARLKEGNDMLAAFGEMLLNSNNLSGVVPQISVVLGPCLGTGAMIAASADFVVMAKGAELKIETNSDDGSVEVNEKAGLCHLVADDDKDAIAKVRNLITMLPANNLSAAPVADCAAAGAGDLISIANSIAAAGEYKADELISAVVDGGSYIELQKNYGGAVSCGLAKLCGQTVGVISMSGKAIDSEACSKAARVIRFCDAFAVPVLTFIDSTGFGSLREAAKLSNAYAEATTIKVSVVTGSAYGPMYIAVAGRGAGSDLTMAWPSASVSALAPETAVAFMWNDKLKGSSNPVADRAKLVAEYKESEACPLKAAADGFVEDVVNPAETRDKLIAALDMLSGKRVSRLPKKHANIQL